MVQLSNKRSTPGEERAQRRAEERRRGILRAAARTFRRLGYAQAGMRDIAAEADLSPGNLYHYFQGKHEILYYCQDRWLRHMLGVLEQESNRSGPVAVRLHSVLVTHVRYLLEELEGSAAHFEVDALPIELRDQVVGKRDRYEAGLAELVGQGIVSGEFRADDAPIVTKAVLGALNWTARWFRPEGPQSAAQIAESFAHYLIRGLKA